jgi:hypothetical protein
MTGSNRKRMVTAQSERGQSLLMVAFAFPGLLGFVALAIDIGSLLAWRTADQRAADSAALAGAEVLYLADDPIDASETAAAIDAAEDYLSRHGYDPVSEAVINSPPLSGEHTCSVDSRCDHYVEVRITRDRDTMLLSIFGLDQATVRSRAVGGVQLQDKPYALIVLNEDDCQSYGQSGESTVTINNGSAIVNSDCNSDSAHMYGQSIITSDGIDFYKEGEWVNEGTSQAVPDPTRVTRQIDDPLADLTRPVPCGGTGLVTDGTCITKSPTSKGTPDAPVQTKCPDSGGGAVCPVASNKVVLLPGTYYGGLVIEGNAGCSLPLSGVCPVEFTPGLYVFAGRESAYPGCTGGSYKCGGFRRAGSNPLGVLSTASASAGVTFFVTDDPYATNASLEDCGPFQIQGTATANLRAPDDPTLDGPLDDMPINALDLVDGVENMLFWVDDDCADPNPTECAKVPAASGVCAFDYAGGNTYSATGIFYVPGATLNITGGGMADAAVQIIVDTFRRSGSADLSITYKGYVETILPWMRLVE